MKVDVIIIGSGIAGLAIAAALGRQKLKALVIGPDITASNFDYEYVFENSTITTLPSLETFESVGFSSPTLSATQTLLCVNSKSLYQRFLMSCADNGVGMMHGRAEKIVSYRKLHRVDWSPNQIGDSQLPKEELFASLVIDASGALSSFSPKPVGFSSTYRKILRGSGDLFGDGVSYFDFSQTDAQFPSFCRGFKHEDGRYFIDEINLYSEAPISEQALSERLSKRLGVSEFTIDEDISSAYHFTPLFAEDRSAKILAFGDAAAMAHPLTGEATSRILNIAPQLAKTIAQSIDKSPQEIADLGRGALFSDGEKRLEDAMVFLAENIFDSSFGQREFFEAIFGSQTLFDIMFSNILNIDIYGTLQGLVQLAGSKKAFEDFDFFKPT